MLKVIYFDEGSALDFIDQYYGGIPQDKTTENYKIETKVAASVEGNIEVGLPKWLEIVDIVKARFKGKGSGDIADTDQYLHEKVISSTILSSFKKMAESMEFKTDLLELKDYKLSIIPDSLTAMKTFTPFLKMFATQMQTIQVINGQQQTAEPMDNTPQFDLSALDFSNLDAILESAKGYYELLATNGQDTKVVRFNLKGLRNNYQLIDFQKMNLTLYGVTVGRCTKESLRDLNEFGIVQSEQEQDRLGGDALNPQRADPDELPIIDILLAGVSRNV